MAKHVIHVSDAEAANDFASLLERVRTGAEIVIEHDARPVAVLHAAEPVRRTISECIALLPEDSTATIDADFAKDVEAAVESQREYARAKSKAAQVHRRAANGHAHSSGHGVGGSSRRKNRWGKSGARSASRSSRSAYRCDRS